MEKEGYVSLWIGNIRSDEQLAAYVEVGYTEDGDCTPSQFLKDFQINTYDFDEDFIERICNEIETQSIGELILGCSYEEEIIPQYEKLVNGVSLEKFNAGILLYNFQYDGRVDSINGKGYEFKFVGSVKYSED